MLELSSPFESYVLIHELPKTRNCRDFLIRLLYEIEGTRATGEVSWPWEYTDAQQRIDQVAGVEGFRLRRERSLGAFQRFIELQLELDGQRIYEAQGRTMLIRGTAK